MPPPNVEDDIDLDDEGANARRKLDEERKRQKEREARQASRTKRFDLLKRIAKRLRSCHHSFEGRKDDVWDSIILTKNLHICGFSIFGLLMSMFIAIYARLQNCPVNKNGPRACLDASFINTRNVTMLALTLDLADQIDYAVLLSLQLALTFTTFICFILIAQLYKLRLSEKRREWSGILELDLVEAAGTKQARVLQSQFEDSYKFWKSGIRWQFLLEIIVHAIHPLLWMSDSSVKGLDTVYEVSQVLIFARLYLVARHLYINSNIYQFRHDIVASNPELKSQGYRVTAQSTTKIVFYNYPGQVALGLVLLPMLCFGYWMFVIESDNVPEFADIRNCFWFSLVTMLTVGYGDIRPISATGRIIVIMLALVSFFANATIGGVVTNLLAPTREQKYVDAYLGQKTCDLAYKKAAVNMIAAAFLDNKTRKAQGIAAGGENRRSTDMYAAVKQLRAARLAARDSLGAAADPVVDAKLQKNIMMANVLNRQLDEQMNEIMKLEQQMLAATILIKQKLSERRS